MNEMLNNPFALTKSEIAIFGLGRDYEQERIIKLLEADGLNCDCDWCQINGDMPSQHHWRILALIKGEK